MTNEEKKPTEIDGSINVSNLNWPTAIAIMVVTLTVALCCLGRFAPEQFNAIFN